VTLFTLSSGCFLQAGAECDTGTPPLDTKMAAAAETAARAFTGDYDGTLTWTRTGATTPIHLAVTRSAEKSIEGMADCNGTTDGFMVPMKLSVNSDDGLVQPSEVQAALQLDLSGAFVWKNPDGFSGDVSFDALKAAGLTPPEWGANFFPKVHIPFHERDLKPLDGTVSVPGTTRQEVVLGTVHFP
jgi:hypothetical protein